MSSFGLLTCSFAIFVVAGFSQTENDSTITTILTPDAVAIDSLATLPKDSTAADSGKAREPLFDFRSQPQFSLRGLYFDSTLIIGSRHTSFGDVFDWMPGGYYYNLGGAGQLAYGSTFGAPAGEMTLEFDGLNLTNPLNGLADFNLIPTQSMGYAGILHSSYKPYGYMPLAQSFHFQSRTIADNPIRSQVGYRTGYYNYDDVDIRVGIKASQKFWLDFGGVIHNYGGLEPNETYSGTKINAKLNRRLGSHWLARYVLLFNVRDTEIPLPDQLQELQDFLNPKQKERRTDHALIVQYKNRFLTTLQYTSFEEELRAADQAVFNELNKARTVRSTTEIVLPFGPILWRNGLYTWATTAQSNNWDNQSDWQADVYSSLAGSIAHRLKWYAGLKLEKNTEFAPKILPEANLFWAIDSTAGLSLWANQIVSYPSLLARYSVGPFAFGDLNLTCAKYKQVGLAGEKQFKNLFIHSSLAFLQRDFQIATFYDGEHVNYTNMPSLSTLCLDLNLDYNFLKKWRFFFKGNAFSDFNAEPAVTQRPNFYTKFFLQYHLLAFKNDLNAQLRAGAFVLGQRLGPAPFYADFSGTTVGLDPVIYPYFHAVLTFGAAEIFFAYENYIDADVQYVYGYSMPQLWFRYGFIWHFID